MSPLSHPRTGIGNYVRGSLAGLAEASAGAHELVAFAPTRLRGRRLIHEALADVPVDVRTLVLPWSHAFRMGWSRLGRPSVERFLGELDVLHFSDWLVPPQRRGLRSTMVHDLVPLLHPEWVTERTRSMHGVSVRFTLRASSATVSRPPACNNDNSCRSTRSSSRSGGLLLMMG